MSAYFERDIPMDIFLIAEILSSYGHEIHLVGGAVRDCLRKVKVSDFDLASSATPEEIIQIFTEKQGFATIPTGLSHGTVTLLYRKKSYEITTYRLDGSYADKRHPDSVIFTSSLHEDLSRRDFTINAMAFNLTDKSFSDPFFGGNDLKAKVIRTVGKPLDRFEEDALRMLRACRFACTLGFQIEEETISAISTLASNIRFVSSERVRDELIKILSSKQPSIGINLMNELNLLQHIIPELIEGVNVDQNEFHKYDVYTHNLKTCDSLESKDYICRLAALFHDIGKPRAKNFAIKIGNGNVFYNHEVIGAKMTGHIMRRLKFSNNEIQRASLLVELHMFYYTKNWTDGAVRRFLRRFDGNLDFMQELFHLREADRKGSGTKKNTPYILHEFKSRIQKVLEIDSALKVSDLAINGTELMELFSLNPGPIIGKILNYLLELVLDDPSINTLENLKSATSSYIAELKVYK